MYDEGQGGPVNYVEARRLLELAAEQGDAQAQCYLDEVARRLEVAPAFGTKWRRGIVTEVRPNGTYAFQYTGYPCYAEGDAEPGVKRHFIKPLPAAATHAWADLNDAIVAQDEGALARAYSAAVRAGLKRLIDVNVKMVTQDGNEYDFITKFYMGGSYT